jgi:hypothetical protein
VCQFDEVLRYKPVLSLEVFIDLIFRPLWSTQPVTERSVKNISWGVKVVSP